MNQILAIDSSSKRGKNREPANIESVTKFFAIIIIIFGAFIIASSSYGMYKRGQVKEVKQTKPTIVLDTKSEDTILLRIMHDKVIQRVEYYWNDDEEPEIIEGKERTYIEQEIKIPGGENTLHVSAIDIEGQENYCDKLYEIEDIIHVDIEQGSGKLKITAQNETEISYMTYRWEDEEETKIDINDTNINTEIDIPKGQHTLTVVLVDVNNKTITKVEEVKGVVRPTLEVGVDDAVENFVIKATDENEIQKVEFIITNSELKNKKFRVKADHEGQKEIEFTYPLTKGENRITIVAYNTDGVSSEKLKKKKTIED